MIVNRGAFHHFLEAVVPLDQHRDSWCAHPDNQLAVLLAPGLEDFLEFRSQNDPRLVLILAKRGR